MTLKVQKSSGNVFADLGFDQPEHHMAKAELAREILAILARKKLTQAKAATLLGIDQPKISALSHGKLSGFSTDRLLRFLTILGQDVEIRLKSKPRSRRRAAILVTRG